MIEFEHPMTQLLLSRAYRITHVSTWTLDIEALKESNAALQ